MLNRYAHQNKSWFEMLGECSKFLMSDSEKHILCTARMLIQNGGGVGSKFIASRRAAIKWGGSNSLGGIKTRFLSGERTPEAKEKQTQGQARRGAAQNRRAPRGFGRLIELPSFGPPSSCGSPRSGATPSCPFCTLSPNRFQHSPKAPHAVPYCDQHPVL